METTSKIDEKQKIKTPKIKQNQTKEKPDEEIDSSESNAVWSPWDVMTPFVIPEMNCTLKGYSIAALRTNFYIKELGIMLDAGLSAPNYAIEHIFITHGHADHVASVPFHIYSRREGIKIQIYAHKEISENVKQFIESAYILSSDAKWVEMGIKKEDLFIHGFYDMIPVTPNESFEILVKNKKMTIEVIKCFHSVPCVGYGFTEKRLKLKEEFKNLSGKEIGELKKKGEIINYVQEYPLFVFLGDTDKNILFDEALKKYKTIMIECTFILDEDLDQAEKTFHMHWKHLEEYIIENKHQTFILYHFSQRYKKKELTDFFGKLNIINVIPWIN